MKEIADIYVIHNKQFIWISCGVLNNGGKTDKSYLQAKITHF